jgi:hypothetical protein
MSNNELTLTYEHPDKKVIVTRRFHVIGDNTLRRTDYEAIYNYTREQWQLSLCHTRHYDIDDDGCLVGEDDEYWSYESYHWESYAIDRHNTLLAKRFPYEQGNEQHTPSVTETAKQLIDANF